MHDNIFDDENVEKSITVVRVSTSYWQDSKGIYSKKSLRYLKRKCVGNWVREDFDNIGAADGFPSIVNIDKITDGVYIVKTCNESIDYETGYLDDWDYELVPYIIEEGA